MNNLRISYPNEFAVLAAAALGVFGYAWMAIDVGSSETSAAMRDTYLSALYLMMFDVIEGAKIKVEAAPKLRDPHSWIHAFYMGYLFCIAMVLLNWEGDESAKHLLVFWGLAGVAFGLAIAFLQAGGNASLADRYDLDNPITDRSFGAIYYIWPGIIVLLIAGLVVAPPVSGWGDDYLLFQLCLLGSVMARYGFRTRNGWWDLYPRTLGFLLFMFGLIAF